MVRRLDGRRFILMVGVVVAALAVTLPAVAQTPSSIRGIVKDTSGKPVEGAKVTIESQGRRFEVKTNKKGEFIQIGLPSGEYKVTAEKDKLTATQVVRVARMGSTVDADLVLGAGGGIDPKQVAALRQAFQAGVDAMKAGKNDEAIAAFNQAIQVNPNCYDCYYNLGYAHMQKKDYDNAEAAYKKSIELKADNADAYSGLANVYNAQRKFDQAAAASQKATELASSAPGGAAGGGSAETLYNQGVILWNSGKIPDAKKAFEAAVQANPNHAESHYQLGMALVNEGNMAGAAAEFETYLKLAPDGPNAATAKSLVAQLKK